MKRRGRDTAVRPREDAVERVPDDLYEKIAQRAYELYERRGGEWGHDMEDWLEAERAVREEASQRA